ncbi:MAG: tRNA 2-thiouridine(34) synthase MnmA [Bacteroidota bacterium]
MKKRVLVAMSGGIDSSLTACLLHEQGYEVLGVTMKTFSYKRSCSTKKQIGCCNLDTIEDARKVAVKLGFPYMVLDIRKEFGDYVVNNFKSEYLAGRTPNPCVLCNTHIKWEALLERADALDCQYIATGHYARVRNQGDRYILYKGVDQRKDQSYALWGLSQASLSRTIFPLGELTKDKVRQLAKEKGFDYLNKKPESYEICFIPDNDYRGFLKRNIEGLERRVEGGEFVLENGQVVGKHEGYPFYTVGQRKGLKIALGYPVYVTEIQPQKNRVVLGTLDDLARNGMWVHKLNMIKYPQLSADLDVVAKVRYNSPGVGAVVQQKNQEMKVFFGKGVRAVAPGQAAVFYEGNDVVGGGWIKTAFCKS